MLRYFIQIFDLYLNEYLKYLVINNRVTYDNILYKYGAKPSNNGAFSTASTKFGAGLQLISKDTSLVINTGRKKGGSFYQGG